MKKKTKITMRKPNQDFSLEVTGTKARCPTGEEIGKKYMAEGRIPVFACEGACIRGEIARVAANLVAKEEPYGRACHGEMFAVPGSGIAQWVETADKVVLIDGCFIRCFGRILGHLIEEEKLIQFDALSHYKKYTDVFDIDAVPEAERNEVAQNVADWVLASLE